MPVPTSADPTAPGALVVNSPTDPVRPSGEPGRVVSEPDAAEAGVSEPDASAPQATGTDGTQADSAAVRPTLALLVPRDGNVRPIVDPLVLADWARRLTGGSGPVALDAERASGYRYGSRAYLVQLRRDDVGTAQQLGWIPPTPAFLLRGWLAKRRLIRK